MSVERHIIHCLNRIHEQRLDYNHIVTYPAISKGNVYFLAVLFFYPLTWDQVKQQFVLHFVTHIFTDNLPSMSSSKKNQPIVASAWKLCGQLLSMSYKFRKQILKAHAKQKNAANLLTKQQKFPEDCETTQTITAEWYIDCLQHFNIFS